MFPTVASPLWERVRLMIERNLAVALSSISCQRQVHSRNSDEGARVCVCVCHMYFGIYNGHTRRPCVFWKINIILAVIDEERCAVKNGETEETVGLVWFTLSDVLL